MTFRTASTAISISSESGFLSPLYAPPNSNWMSDKTLDSTQDVMLRIRQEFDSIVTALLQDISMRSDFSQKYELTGTNLGEPYMYLFTTLCVPYKYTLEAFPKIDKPSHDALTKGPEAFRFHEVFEFAIERYTGSSTKPNGVLRETRSTDFCYPVSISIEAVPCDKAQKPWLLLLFREFQILVGIWEQYRNELKQKTGSIDHMVGFPMPFEFCSVTGTELDIPAKTFDAYNYYDVAGNLTDLRRVAFQLPLTKNTTIGSTLSYMSMEKLGPGINYLMDLLRAQSKMFSLGSALMVYDQLLCRLVVMHKYGVIHGDLNTSCLRFGSGNACNVLYISDYSTCILAPSKAAPGFLFHDRFVSNHRLKDKSFHFVNDLESAYYIFLLMVVGYLPWDGKLRPNNQTSVTLLDGQGPNGTNVTSDFSNVQKDKEMFWESPNIVRRLVTSREYEIDGILYRNFIEDLMLTIYTKMKDILTLCHGVSQSAFIRDINIFGTVACSAYLGLRKSIASYFRFETMSVFLRDPAVDAKIGMLRAHDPEDRRAPWDLSSWCWNNICVDSKTVGHGPSITSKMSAMQKTAE